MMPWTWTVPAQEPPATPAAAPEAAERPGRFRVGPFYLTPYFRIGTIGLDTNVFYTATETRADVSASGGPGLIAVLPLAGTARVELDSGANYLYFVRTASQRRLLGTGQARLSRKTSRSFASIEESYQQTYGRPSFEVDRRIVQTTEATRLRLERRLFGRFSLALEGSRGRSEAGEDETFLGADLRKNLSVDTYRGLAELACALTVKTSVVVQADYQADRSLFDVTRNADSNRVWGGLRTDATALISGRAFVGRRSFRLQLQPRAEKRLMVAEVDAMLNVSPKTHVGGSFTRDLGYSAFSPSGDTPTLRTEAVGARIEKALVGRLDLRLFARKTRLVTDGAVRVELPSGQRAEAVRDDTAREAGADLGYTFRTRLRIGLAATYAERRSTIAYFGIKGLLVGATVSYQP